MHQLIGKNNKIIIYLIFLIILSTTNGRFKDNLFSHSSKVNKININGLSEAKNKKIISELNNLFYKNILFIRKDEIKKVMSKYNIIEKYNIKKIYPSIVNITIKPTKFVARLPNEGHFLFGANGKLIKSEKNKEILPYIFGKFNSKDFLIFKKEIEKSKFTFIKLKTLYFFPSNRWDILTKDNVLIKLPQDNYLESLHLAHKIISSDNFKNKKLVDLRVDSHLIIK